MKTPKNKHFESIENNTKSHIGRINPHTGSIRDKFRKLEVERETNGHPDKL
jgi:hypothetical protein